MTRYFLALFCVAVAWIPGLSLLAQTESDLNEGSRLARDTGDDSFNFSWWGKSGRTYFVQQSDDLFTWNYVPIIESGFDDVVNWGFTSSASKFFVRLKFSDIPTINPFDADFDGDKVGNYDEILAGLDPLSFRDTNGNEIADDWERFHFQHLGVDPGALATNGTALTIGQCYTLGINPNEYYSGNQPVIIAVSGNGQSGTVDTLLPEPLTVRIQTAGGVALGNAPVRFLVQNGGSISSDGVTYAQELVTTTNSFGHASVQFKLPSTASPTATVVVIAGPSTDAAQFTFSAFSLPLGVPTIAAASKVAETVSVAWSDGDAASPTLLQRRAGTAGAWKTVATLPVGVQNYVDTDTYLGQRYEYRLGKTNTTGGMDFTGPLVTADSSVPTYAAIDLGDFWGSAMNNVGQIAGDYQGKLAIWSNGQVIPIPEGQSYEHSWAMAIDDLGRVAGWVSDDYINFLSFLWTPGVGGAPNVFTTFTHGTNEEPQPSFIRPNGDLVGQIYKSVSSTTIPNRVPHGYRLGSNGSLTDLGLVTYDTYDTILNLEIDPVSLDLPEGALEAARLALWCRVTGNSGLGGVIQASPIINRAGETVQVRYIEDGTTTTGGMYAAQPSRWGSGGIVPIGGSLSSPDGSFVTGVSAAGDILLRSSDATYLLHEGGDTVSLGPVDGSVLNSNLQVAGIYKLPDFADGYYTGHPFAYDRGVLAELSLPLGPPGAFVTGLNDSGQIIGSAGNMGEGEGSNTAILWQNGEAYNLDDLVNSPGLHVYKPHAIANDQSILATAYRLPGYVDGDRLLIPGELSLYPETAEVIAADEEPFTLTASATFGNRVSEAHINWSVTGSHGGSLATPAALTSSGLAGNEFTPGTTAGLKYQIQASVDKIFMTGAAGGTATEVPIQMVAASQTIEVGPGAADSISVVCLTNGQTATSLPADGQSEMRVTATLKDRFGNPVAAGTHVFWRLKGDGDIIQSDEETNGLGVASATLRAGRIPGLFQTLIIESDLTRQEIDIENAALTFSLAADAPVWNTVDGVRYGLINVTATVNVPDGTPIRWAATTGSIGAREGVVQNGTAQTFVHLSPNDGVPGLAVITAAVAKSIAKCSADLGTIRLQSAAPGVSPAGGPYPTQTSVSVHYAPLANQRVRFTSGPLTNYGKLAVDNLQLVTDGGAINGVPIPTGSSEFFFSVGATPQAFGVTLLEVAGGYALKLDSTGHAVFEVHCVNGVASVVLADASVPPIGEPREISARIVNGQAYVSSGGFTASTPLRGPPLLATAQLLVPAAQIPSVDQVVFRWWQSTALPTLVITGVDGDNTIVLDGDGKGTVTVAAPADAASGLGMVSAAPHASDTGVDPVSLRVPVVTYAAEDLGADLLLVEDLHRNVQFANGALTAEEQNEYVRHGVEAYVAAKSAEFASTLDDIVPLADGGGLPQQAAQSKRLLQLAELMNSSAGKLRQLGEDAENIHIHVGDGGLSVIIDPSTGKVRVDNGHGLLLTVNLADEIRQAFSNAGKRSDNLAGAGFPLVDGLLDTKVVSAANFEAAIQWLHGSQTYRRARSLAAKVGALPFRHDFAELARRYTPEGTAEFFKAVGNLAGAVNDNLSLSILASQSLASMEGLLKNGVPAAGIPGLNSLGADGDLRGRMIAAYLGYDFQLLSTIAAVSAQLSDAQAGQLAVLKRMLGQLTGLAISAACGHTESQRILGEMVPVYSWELLHEDVAQLWDNGDYFGAGQKSFDLAISVIGDATLYIPAVKGAAMIVKLGHTASVSVVQALRRGAVAIERFAGIKPGARVLMQHVAMAGRLAPKVHTAIEAGRALELVNIYVKNPTVNMLNTERPIREQAVVRFVDRNSDGYRKYFEISDIVYDEAQNAGSVPKPVLARVVHLPDRRSLDFLRDEQGRIIVLIDQDVLEDANSLIKAASHELAEAEYLTQFHILGQDYSDKRKWAELLRISHTRATKIEDDATRLSREQMRALGIKGFKSNFP